MKSKRILTLLMTIMLIASCISVPAMAAEEAAITYPWTAMDDFTSYGATSSGIQLSTYTYSEGTQHGEGFSTKWSDDVTKDGEVTNEGWKVYKPATSDARVMLGTTSGTLYRKLENPIDFSETGRRYVFSFMLSSSQYGKDVSYLLGNENLYFGFKLDTTVSSKREVKPMLCVGSEIQQKSTGVYFEALKNSVNETKYVVELTVDLREGADSLKVKHYKEKGSSSVYDIEKEVELSSYGKMEYVGLKATSASTGVWNVSAAGYDTSAHEAIRTRIVDKIPSYEAYLDLEAQGTDFTFYDECKAMFESYGVAYESFESYLSSSKTLTDSGYAASYVDGITSTGLNGGVGWNSFWANGKTGEHQCNTEKAYIAMDNRTGRGTERNLAHNGLSDKPMYRLLKTPIDLSKDGEYYVKVLARPSMAKDSVAIDDYDFRFYVGDNIYFGTKYSADSDTAYKFPLNLSVTGAETEYQLDMNLRAETTLYYHYVLKIESKSAGNDIIALKMWHDTEEEPMQYNMTTEIDSSEAINFVRLFNNSPSNVKVSDIAIAAYNGQDILDAREAITKLGNGTMSYEDAYNRVSMVKGIAKQHLLIELEDSKGYISVEGGSFKSSDGITLIDTSKITDSVMYSFRLKNNFRVSKSLTAVMAVYNGDTLWDTKSLSLTLPARTTTELQTLGFENEPLPEDMSNISVKVFFWNMGTLLPYTEEIVMYSHLERSVEPEIFGSDTDEPVTVAFMGDSITHLNPSYAKWIEYYYRIKYPNKNIKFVSKGISGDSCAGIESRFSWDILNDPNTGRPDEACLMIGMNDVGRSQYPDNATEEQKQKKIDDCLENIRDVAELCRENDIKLTLITPPLYDEADYTSIECYTGVNAALGKIADGVIKIANEENLAYVDFYGYINSFNQSLRSTDEYEKAMIFNVSDRVHATANGTFAEGFIFINQQVNDPFVAYVDINAETSEANAVNAVVSEITMEGDELSYTYEPGSLPMYMTDEYKATEEQYGIPVTQSINREIIKVSGLAEGNYEITMNGTSIGVYSSDELVKGVNIAVSPDNPGYIQSQEVYELVTSKMSKDNLLRNIAYVERSLVNKVDLTDVDACIEYFNSHYSDSTDSRFVKYVENKGKQASAVTEIAELEAQAMLKAVPGRYNIRITRQ